MLALDAVNDWIDVPNVPHTTAQTPEAWLTWTPAANRVCLLRSNCGGVCAGTGGFEVELYPSCNGTGTRRWGTIPYSSIPSGPFHIALVSADGVNASLYINGTLVGSKALALDNGVSGTYLGGIGALDNDGTPMDFTAATLYGVRYSSAAKYSAAFTPVYPLPTQADSVVNYLFTNGSGTTVTDSSGGSRHGTILGGATWNFIGIYGRSVMNLGSLSS